MTTLCCPNCGAGFNFRSDMPVGFDTLSPQQRDIVEILMARVNEWITVDGLVDAMYCATPDDRLPKDAKGTVIRQVMLIRKKLGYDAVERSYSRGYRIPAKLVPMVAQEITE